MYIWILQFFNKIFLLFNKIGEYHSSLVDFYKILDSSRSFNDCLGDGFFYLRFFSNSNRLRIS